MNAVQQTQGAAASPDVACNRVGSQLLLRKLPLLAKAYACAQEDPADPNTECNVLCFGSDVYRIISLTSDSIENEGVLRVHSQKRSRRTDESPADDSERISWAMDCRVALPTQVGFLATIEDELRKSSAIVNNTTQKREGAAKGGTGDGEKKRRTGSKVDVANVSKEANGGTDEENAVDDDSEAQRKFPSHGREEHLMLQAIRKPLEGGMRSTAAVSAGTRAAERKMSGNSSVPGRLPWEAMAESIETRGEIEGKATGDAVRSYLRRVLWIEQQKKRQSQTVGAAETNSHSEQLWANMTEVERVQKEIRRVRMQRRQFHRERPNGG